MSRSVLLRIIVLLAGATALFLLSWMRRNNARTPLAADSDHAIGSLAADQQTLLTLRSAGADLTKATEVNFYLYFPTREAADSACAQATTPQLHAQVDRAASGSSWLCLLSGTMVPTETAIHAESIRLGAIAKVHGGDYDGWEAAAVTP